MDDIKHVVPKWMFFVAMLRETQAFILKFISTNTANVADVLLVFIYENMTKINISIL